MPKPIITGTGGLADSPAPTEMVHGGFRSNRHHEAIEEMADETGMGRDILRSSERLPGLESDGHARMMRSQPSNGSADNIKTSPWSK